MSIFSANAAIGEPIETCPKAPGVPYVLLVSGADYDGCVPVLAEWNPECTSDGWAEWQDGELCGTGLRRGCTVRGWLYAIPAKKK